MATFTKSMAQNHLMADQPCLEIHLSKQQVYSTISHRARQSVQAVRGSLWVTLAGDSKDYILHSGEQMVLPRGKKAVVEALSESSFRIQ